MTTTGAQREAGEALDRARAEEATRIVFQRGLGVPVHDVAMETARLAREGWKSKDLLLREAREILSQVWAMGDMILRGHSDNTPELKAVLAALRRGIEIGRAER